MYREESNVDHNKIDNFDSYSDKVVKEGQNGQHLAVKLKKENKIEENDLDLNSKPANVNVSVSVKKKIKEATTVYQPPHVREMMKQEKEKTANNYRRKAKSFIENSSNYFPENSKYKTSLVISSTGTGKITLNVNADKNNH